MTENTITLIAIAVATVAQVILQVLARFDSLKMAQKVEEARVATLETVEATAGKVEEVKVALAENTQSTESIHDLVNGAKAALAAENAALKQIIADMVRAAAAAKEAPPLPTKEYHDQL